MNKKLIRKCPTCGCTIGKKLGEVKMLLSKYIKLPAQYDIVACDKCGFTFADSPSNQDDYNTYYASNNNYSDEVNIKPRTIVQSSKAMGDFICKYVSKDEKILDIGSGSGELLIELKKRGYTTLWGLDPSQSSIDNLVKCGINGTKRNIFDEKDKSIGEFDVVVTTQVAEHICDLNGFIENARKYMRDGGKIFVTVPAVEGFERYYQSKPNYFNHEHINYFSKKSLRNLFGKNGFVSLAEDGEFYKIEHPKGVVDLLLQNIFEYRPNEDYIMEKDEISSVSIENYLKQCNDMEQISQVIKEVKKTSDKCIVWGAGSLTNQLMCQTNIFDSVLFFVDNNKEKWGKDISGKIIYTPDVLMNEKYRDVPIVIMCMHYSEMIKQQIKNMGLDNRVIVYE